jgi:hypothetical protein
MRDRKVWAACGEELVLDIDYILEKNGCSAREPGNELYLHVVLRAFADLRPSAWKSVAITNDARYWLLHDNHDFDLVCKFAGVDPDCIRKIAEKYVAYLDGGGKPKRIVLGDAE